LVVLLGSSVGGCGGGARTIEVDRFINTAMHRERDEAGGRSGEPLELAVVYVTGKDLKNEANGRLDPEAGITSDVWFRDRPQPGDTEDMEGRGSRFWLSPSQVLVLTDDESYFGTKVRRRLDGAAYEAEQVKIKLKGPPRGTEVIYVFPKFIDPDAQVLPVRPATFHSPAKWQRDQVIRIGVDENREHYGQYIEIVERGS